MDLRNYLIEYGHVGSEQGVLVSVPSVSCVLDSSFAPLAYDVAWLLSNEHQYKDTNIPILLLKDGNCVCLSRYGVVKPIAYGDKCNAFAITPNIHITIPDDVCYQNCFNKIMKRLSRVEDSEFQQFVNDIYFKGGKAYVKSGAHITNKPSENVCAKLNTLYKEGELVHNGNVYYANNSKLDTKSTKLIPEFDYNGKKYVRLALPDMPMIKMLDGAYSYASSPIGSGAIWLQIDDIEWEIINWQNLPSIINPKGDGKDGYMNLVQTHATSLGYKLHEDYNVTNEWGNTSLHKCLNHNALADYGLVGQGYLYECFESNKAPVLEVTIGADESSVAERAFAGCSGISKINIAIDLDYIYPKAFEDCGFKYVYKLKGKDFITFDKNIPNLETIDYMLDLDKLQSVVFDYENKFSFLPKDLEKDILITDILEQQKITMPSVFYESVRVMPIEEISTTFAECKFYKKQVVPEIAKVINNEGDLVHRDSAYKGLINLASALGCFSSELIENKGKMVPLSQKACSFLSDVLSKELINEIDLMRLSSGGVLKTWAHQFLSSEKDRFDRGLKLPKASSRLLDFLSMPGKDIKYPHLNMILDTYKDYPQMFATVIRDFDDIEDARKTVDKDGLPRVSSWLEVLPRYLARKTYPNVEDKYRYVAELFAKHDLSESSLNETIDLIKFAEENNVPHHLLGRELKQKIEENSDNYFTYEWLDKHSPINAILGIWTDCCAAINKGVDAGTDIAKNSIISPNIQNLVVRNKQGKIVAKIAGYLNRERGEMLFNSFEVSADNRNKKFTIGDKTFNSSDEIFNTFILGIEDFVAVYNKENPNSPLRKVSIGYNHEVLKKQLDTLSFEFKENIEVPPEYGFKETNIQYVIYDANKTNHM